MCNVEFFMLLCVVCCILMFHVNIPLIHAINVQLDWRPNFPEWFSTSTSLSSVHGRIPVHDERCA